MKQKQGGKQQQQHAAGGGDAKKKKMMRFRHVRFNKVYANLTWEGPPINITDWGIVLDPSVYRSVDGEWKTILNK